MSPRRRQRVSGVAKVCILGIAAAASRMAFAGSAGVDVFVPAVARAVGQANATFYSTLWITNINSSAANIDVRFHETGVSNTNPQRFFDTLQSGETKKYENVVETKFGRASASGSLRIVATLPVLASTRTYDVAPGGNIRDSKGLYFAGIPVDVAIGRGQSTLVQGVSQGGSEDFRYNFGALETSGQEATILATLRDATGTSLGAKAYVLPPYGRIQFPVTDLRSSVATTNATVEIAVTAGLGRVLAYGTQIANGSNDSSGFEMSFSGYGAGSASAEHCGTDSPGQTLYVGGKTWIIIETEVILEGTSRAYVLRYPVVSDEYGFEAPIRRVLHKVCVPPTASCYYEEKYGSICSYTATLGSTAKYSFSRYRYSANSGTGESTVVHFVTVITGANIVIDDQYETLQVSMNLSMTISQKVTDLSAYGYSLINAHYPGPPVDLLSLEREAATLFDHVSVRPR